MPGRAVGTRRYRAVMIRILVDNEDDRAAVLAAMEQGRLTDLLVYPFTVAWTGRDHLPRVAGEDLSSSAAEGSGS